MTEEHTLNKENVQQKAQKWANQLDTGDVEESGEEESYESGNMYQTLFRDLDDSSEETMYQQFKHVKGKKMLAPTLLPQSSKCLPSHVINKDVICLTDKQTEYIYNQVENNKIVSSEDFCSKCPSSIQENNDESTTMTHLHDQEKNPYEALWIHDYEACDVNKPVSDIEHWSILSTQISYVQYDKYTNGHFKLDVRVPIEKYNCKVYEKFQYCERTLKELNFNQ